MARSLSSMAFNSIMKSTHLFKLKVPQGSVFSQGMRYSTRISGDPDTHEDFHPTSNLESSGISLQDIVRQDVKENAVMIYMKGLPDAPRCGFSALAVKVLQQYHMGPSFLDVVEIMSFCHGVSISARNILENPELKEGIKAVTNWPTFPQIFIKGEFIGGSDIVLNMHQNGELKNLLADITPDSGKE